MRMTRTKKTLVEKKTWNDNVKKITEKNLD